MLGVPRGAGAAHVVPLGPIRIEQIVERRQHLGKARGARLPVAAQGMLDRVVARGDDMRQPGRDIRNRQHGHGRPLSLPTVWRVSMMTVPNTSATEVTYPPQRAV